MSSHPPMGLAPSLLASLVLALLATGCDVQQSPPAEEPLATSESSASPELPNLLFIVTDDQRFDMLGAVHPFLETPNMDRLAAEGVRFENAFVTTPICAASRASLLTGLVERTHGYSFGTPPLAEQFVENSYPVLLRQAGYRTGFIGKFGVRAGEGAVERMFDTYRPFAAPYFKEQEDGSTRHLTDITADEAVTFLRSGDRNRPFALTLSFNAPHADDGDERQYIWPEAMDGKYDDVAIPAPPLSDPAFFESLPEFLREPALNRVRWYWRFDTPEKAERMTRGYLRMISGVDAAIGRVLEELASLDLAADTIVILMGDNGYFLGERGYAGKWLPLELSIRVPLIVYDPRAATALRGALPTLPALNIDIAPTLLDLAGVEVPSAMQGASLVPILAGGSPAGWRSDFFVEHLTENPQIPKHEGVRGERYKYARYFEQDPVYEELYDVLADPQETRNLAGDPDHAEILAEMRRRTDELRAGYETQASRTGDVGPGPRQRVDEPEAGGATLVRISLPARFPQARFLPPGDHELGVEHAGRARSYLVHMPPAARSGEPLPVVVNFHGGGGHAAGHKENSRMDEAADRDGYIAVYPNGIGRLRNRLLTWNAGTCCGYSTNQDVDDVGFVVAMLGDLGDRTPLNRRRVYATGLSNGAMMSYRMAVDASEHVAAIAPVAGAMMTEDGEPARAVPVMHFHSVDDARALYDGGLGPRFPYTNNRVDHTSVDDTISRWIGYNGCSAEPEIGDTLEWSAADNEIHTATRFRYGGCRDGADVTLWKLTGAGHVWPGGAQRFAEWLLGPSTEVVDANTLMWEFFARFEVTEERRP